MKAFPARASTAWLGTRTGILVAGLVAVTVTVAITERDALAQPAGLDPYQLECIRAAATEPGAVGQWAVVRRSTAPFSSVETLLDAFSREFAGQGLDDLLLNCHDFESKAVVIVYQDPRGLNEVPLAVGLTVPGPIVPKEPLTLERFLEPVAVTYTHIGPYEELDRVYDEILKSLPTGGKAKFPAWLRLVNDPRRVDPSLIQTDFVVPVDRPATLSDAEKERIAEAVKSAAPVDYLLVSQTFRGTIGRLGDFLDQFMIQFEEQKLGDKLASQDTAPLALLHSDPDEGGEIEIEIGFPLVAASQVVEPLRLRDIKFDRTVLYTHMGEFGRLGVIHDEIARVARSAISNGVPMEPVFPAGLRLLTDPDKVAKTDELKTQLVVPLRAVGGG